MNGGPLVHLLWKEYRAIRGFWLALIALAVCLQLLILATSADPQGSRLFVYHVALAAPAFFALGCAGTAFAIEKEEGTFDWLQASPAVDRQVLASKLGLAAVATLAMYLVLWPVAFWMNRSLLPDDQILRAICGLWLPAAGEALAWGVLFSLLSARPLMAVILALVAATTTTHLLAGATTDSTSYELRVAPYAAAIPWRMGVMLAVLAADVVLGLQWLRGAERSRTSGTTGRRVLPTPRRLARESRAADRGTYLRQPDRVMIVGRLLWQHVRQSWRLMLLLPALQVALSLVILFSGIDTEKTLILFPLMGMAALMGAAVFLPDQERRHYRFFVEHNVPPRAVWLTRIVPWLIVVGISTSLVVTFWIGGRPLANLVRAGLTILQAASINEPVELNQWYFLPPRLMLGIVGAMLAFAGGQWVSMFVRSGLLAGFAALLAAAVLFGWLFFVFWGQLSWLLLVLPIPLVLLWATWLRAPDWIQEAATRRVRSRAVLAVLVPALAIVLPAPFLRVAQVPQVDPGFSPSAYLAEITPEALATGELYRRASELLTFPAALVDQRDPNWIASTLSQRGAQRKPVLSPDERDFVKQNQEPLELILQAAARPQCVLANPATLTDWPVVREPAIVSLVLASGRQLEADGDLDGALDRYFLALTVIGQLNSHAPDLEKRGGSWPTLDRVFRELTGWAAHPAQTPERMRQAIERLEQESSDVLHAADRIKSNYVLNQRAVAGEQAVLAMEYYSNYAAWRKPIGRLMPWEIAREKRQLNVYARSSLQNLSFATIKMDNGQSAQEFAYPFHDYDEHPSTQPSPFFRLVGSNGPLVVANRIAVEMRRRATLVVMACEAYRLEHGELPESLDKLVTADNSTTLLRELPKDPYSGRPFVYFREGIPRPDATVVGEDTREGWHRVPVGPGIWSPGWQLVTRTWNPSTIDEPDQAEVVYYNNYLDRRWWGSYSYERRLRGSSLWRMGKWFSIPTASSSNAEEEAEGEAE